METISPDVDVRDVIADQAVINYAFTDMAHIDLVKDVLVRQKERMSEETQLIQAYTDSDDVLLFLVSAEMSDDFLLKYMQCEDPDEANILYHQPLIDLDERANLVLDFGDDDHWMDEAIDNS